MNARNPKFGERSFAGAYVDEAINSARGRVQDAYLPMRYGRRDYLRHHQPRLAISLAKGDYLEGNPDVKSWAFVLDDNPALLQEEKDYLSGSIRVCGTSASFWVYGCRPRGRCTISSTQPSM